MNSSLSSSSPFLLIDKNRFGFRRRCCCDVSSSSSSSSTFGFSNSILNLKHRRLGLLYASIAERNLDTSWLPPDSNVDDDYGDWAVVETEIKTDQKKGFTKFLFVGTGVSVAIMLAAIGYYSLSTKGFQLSDTLHAFQRKVVTSESTIQSSSVADSNASDVSSEESEVTDANPEYISDETTKDHASASVEKVKRVIIPAVDSTQHEALQVLKKLKIIEDDVKADQLCTRREYARWLIKANSVLERIPKHRIVPSMLLAGSWVEAFDDVNIEDPDFWSIQALAEAGLLGSKLSGNSSTSADLDELTGKRRVDFLPESFISRLDLLNWKTQLEYSFIPRIEGKISRKNIDLMDAKAISPDASVELFMDILAGDKSILRKVFGQSRRFQPGKPATKAQAAVALASGRTAGAILTELSRIEDENRSLKAEMNEIRSELLSRGEIQRFWEVKMDELKAYGFEAERNFRAAILELEQEKNAQGTWLVKLLREKAALDCQRQFLLSLKEEVEEMSERITRERADFEVEKQDLEIMSIELQVQQDDINDSKSILEAEKEALQILRSWVEDEAKQNQARAKVLEAVGRRWKWDDRD